MRSGSFTRSDPCIEIAHAHKHFGAFHALNDINLEVETGEIVTLLGPSGCGKTTLMRLIAGFESPSSGLIKLDGRDVSSVPPERRPVNMVFQRYALFPHLNVFENVAFGLKVKRVPAGEIRARVHRMLEIVQLEQLATRCIDELSGGQCQRVALARALVNGPKVLLLDEPLAALDLKIRQHMLQEMKRIHAETGATFVYVTHDQHEAMILSDRIVLMEKGRVVQVDSPEVMYARPGTLFAAKFLGDTNLFEGTIATSDRRGTLVRTSGGQAFLAEASNSFVSGDKVFVSLRPEAISFAETAGDPGLSTSGVIRDIVFTGSSSSYTLRLGEGAEIRVQVQGAARSRAPSIGSDANVSWEQTNVILLPA